MHVILDRVNKIIDENKDKLKNPTCATCVHLHDREWAKRYGKVCCSIWQVCDHYINPNRKYDREQKTYTRRQAIRLVLIMNMVMIILKTEKDA